MTLTHAPAVFCSSSVSGDGKVKTSRKEVLRRIMEKMPKNTRFKQTFWSKASRNRLRITLQIPFIRGFYFSRLKVYQKSRSVYNSDCSWKCSCLFFNCCLLCVVVNKVISLIYCCTLLVWMTTRGHSGLSTEYLRFILCYHSFIYRRFMPEV